MTHQVYLSLGSNLGDRFNNLKRAYEKLNEHPDIQVVKASDFYQTSPVGGVPQDDFINQAMHIQTTLEGEELLAYIHEIEADLLRIRGIVWGPRTIDIDILFYDDQVNDSKYLTIPHPEVYNRLFVLIPLKEIMPADFPHAQKVLTAIENLHQQGEQTIERAGEEDDRIEFN